MTADCGGAAITRQGRTDLRVDLLGDHSRARQQDLDRLCIVEEAVLDHQQNVLGQGAQGSPSGASIKAPVSAAQ
jgi:hypothetical protein